MGQSFRSPFRLSTGKAEITHRIASGTTNQQIAGARFITEKTVKNHINRVFDTPSRSQAAAEWLGAA